MDTEILCKLTIEEIERIEKTIQEYERSIACLCERLYAEYNKLDNLDPLRRSTVSFIYVRVDHENL